MSAHETPARRKIREAVEARGYVVTEMWWEPWRAASEMEGIGGGWVVYVEPRDGGEGGVVLGLSWQEVIETFESDRDFPPVAEIARIVVEPCCDEEGCTAPLHPLADSDTDTFRRCVLHEIASYNAEELASWQEENAADMVKLAEAAVAAGQRIVPPTTNGGRR